MQNECQNIEYKESWRDEYLKWVCGFANAQGGKIFIGVSDSKEVVGIANAEKLMEDIPNKIESLLGIVAEINLLVSEGKNYIEIDVEPSNIPISYHGHYHYRSGSTKQELTGSALQEFIFKKMGHQWDDVFHTTATMDCIDSKAISYLIKKGVNAHRLGEDSLGDTPEDVLDNLHMKAEDGHITHAAILLFAKCPQKYFPGIQFKIGKFGENESDLIVQDVIEGNILQMADKVVEVLKAKYLHSPIHYEGMQRIEPLEIPETALREIIYNAIIHKKYPGAAIQMRVYDDHIEVWNEGGLPEGYTINTLFSKHASRPRNGQIAETFYKAGFVETWGRGYKKIQDSLQTAQLEMPVVEEDCGGILVSVQRPHVGNHVGDGVGSHVGDKKIAEVSERQRKILQILMINPQSSAQQMSVMLSVSRRTIERELAIMQQNGMIRHEGNARFGSWVVIR